YAYDTVVASEQLYPSSQMLSEVTGVPVQPNKAIIGRNAFAHEAGIHQDGVLKNPLTYEIMTPQSVGVPDSRLVLGKHSGRHALSLRCEQLGYQFDRRELDEVYRRFVVLADQIKHVEDHHLLELIRESRPALQRMPPAHVEAIPPAAIMAAGGGQSYHGAAPLEGHPLEITMHSVSDHHGEQEDYLGGVEGRRAGVHGRRPGGVPGFFFEKRCHANDIWSRACRSAGQTRRLPLRERRDGTLAEKQFHVDIGPRVLGRDYFVWSEVPKSHRFIQPDRRFKYVVGFEVESSCAAGLASVDDSVKQLASNASPLASGCHRHFRDFEFGVAHTAKRTAAHTPVIYDCQKYLAT